MDRESFINRINNCFLGAQIGSIIGHKLEGSNFSLSFNEIRKKYGLIDDILDERSFDNNLDWEIAEIAIKAYLKKQGRINYRDFSQVLVNEYNIERLDRFINDEDFKAPTYYEFRNACELIKKGVPEKIVGYFNIISSSSLCLAVPIGLFNIFDPEQAFYDGLEVTSSYQREIGRSCPAILSAYFSMLFNDSRNFDDLIKTLLGYADVEISIYNGTELDKANISSLIRNIIEISSKYKDAYSAIEEIHKEAVKGTKSRLDQEPLNILQKMFGILNITKFDFERAVIGAANLSGNSTTIGFICGAITGARSERLPDKWVEKVPSYRREKIRRYSEYFSSLIFSQIDKREKWIEEIEKAM
ncbi:MAG: ADP-ribosylglycohydrolase family protein [Actinobacteria bacterium]|nr:ADP-ribosylglycohydrolase family protein [Actinomycetota bacterium]